MSACYLDASALVKLAVREPESEALRGHLGRYNRRLASRLAAVEVPRALARRGAESVAVGAAPLAAAMEVLAFIELDPAVASTAAALEPASLRSLDAIHLASALAVGDDLDAFITYDMRLADAARNAGLTVAIPS